MATEGSVTHFSNDHGTEGNESSRSLRQSLKNIWYMHDRRQEMNQSFEGNHDLMTSKPSVYFANMSNYTELTKSTRTEMTLHRIPDSTKPTKRNQYKGKPKRWPGVLFLLLVVAGSIFLLTWQGLHSYDEVNKYRKAAITRAQIRARIKDGLTDDELEELAGDNGVVGNPNEYPPAKCVLPDYQSKNGQFVVVAPNGTEYPISIKGTNWFGMETGQAIPFGLWENDKNGTTAYEVASFLARNKFNSIRLPLCIKNILTNAKPERSMINVNSNRAIDVSNYLNFLKSIIKALGFRQITVLISLHTLDQRVSGGSWFNEKLGVSQSQFLKAVDTLTTSLCTDEYWNVVGLDLKNEPNDCGWGPDDGGDCDWVEGAAIIANRMHANCPQWLGFVEGPKAKGHTMTSKVLKQKISYFDWWGGRLQDAAKIPIEFKLPNKLVWAPHYYTSAVSVAGYLYSELSGTPGASTTTYVEYDNATLQSVISETMEDMFGYLRKEQKYSLLLGEYGGLYAKDQHPLHTTSRAVDYTVLEIKKKGYSGGYMWSLNPESAYDFPSPTLKKSTAEGLLQDDWLHPNEPFMKSLAQLDDMENLRPFPCFPIASKKKKV